LLTASNDTVAAGEQSLNFNNAGCHCRNTIPSAGHIAPDLRYGERKTRKRGSRWHDCLRISQLEPIAKLD
jgi:hypothetical protein